GPALAGFAGRGRGALLSLGVMPPFRESPVPECVARHTAAACALQSLRGQQQQKPRRGPFRPMPATEPAPSALRGRKRRTLRAVWPLLLIMMLMLASGIASVLVVSWTRAAEHGLSLWAVAEHQAVHELRRFADTGDEAHYQRFLSEMNVPRSFDSARLQLKSDHPDLAQIRASIQTAGVPPRDVDGIIWLFRMFKHFPPVVRAMDLWGMGSTLASELPLLGAGIRAEYAGGQPDMARVRELRERAEGVHARIR